MAKKSSSYLSREHFLGDLRLLSSKGRRFCFLLGSGASISSGIPSGKMMMMDWRKTLLDKTEEELRFLCERSNVPWREWKRISKEKYEFPSEDYFTLYDLCYMIDPDSGEEYLSAAMEKAQPSQGYHQLAKLMAKTEHKVVITTNFDYMVENLFPVDKLGQYQKLDPDNAHRLKMKKGRPRYPLIAKVHGDAMLNPLNRSGQLKELAPVWRDKLPVIFASYIPIVIGYGGGDRTLMAYLEEECTWLERVYWCSMGEKETDTIERYLQAEEYRYLVQMEETGFDGIMAEIYDALMPGEGTKPAETPTAKPSKPTPVAPSTAPVKTPAPEPEKPLPVLSRGRLLALDNKDTIETLVFRDTLAGAPEESRDLSQAGDESVLCWRVGNTLTIAGEGGVAAPESCKELFEYWKALRTVTGAELLDTSGVTNMWWMFDGCGSLQTLEVGSWNTGNVKTMWGMFYGCGSLQTLEVGSWNTGNVKNMRNMFRGCGSLQTLEVGSWNTGNVMNMGAMFYGCGSLERLEVGSWNTGNVTDMWGMFWGCGSLQTLEVGSWNTGNVTDMDSMFHGCGSLEKLEVGSWNTGNVTDMCAMFRDCGSLQTLDVRSWNTEKVTDMFRMFYGCGSLQTLDVGSWNTGKVKDTRCMFDGTRWESNPPIRRIEP